MGGIAPDALVEADQEPFSVGFAAGQRLDPVGETLSFAGEPVPEAPW